MKKVLAIVLPILIIAGGLFALYKFVLVDMLDPPPEKVMTKVIEAAQSFVNNHTESNESDFVEHFSTRTREGLEREWSALALDGSRRGSWYEMASGLLNTDGTRPEVIRVEEVAAEEGGEEEGAEEEDEEAQNVNVIIRQNREERPIPMVRDQGRWRIEIPIHPQPWASGVSTGG